MSEPLNPYTGTLPLSNYEELDDHINLEESILSEDEPAEMDWEELRNPLVELLLCFYNDEDHGHPFVDKMTAIFEVLCRW